MKLIKELNIALPGDVYPTLLPVGTEVTGEVAQAAIQAGCVEGDESAAWAAKAAEDACRAVEAELMELGVAAEQALQAVSNKQAELDALAPAAAKTKTGK